MMIAIVSGGFDPLHKGHIEYIKMAREFIGPEGLLIAIVNRDSFLLQKKGYKLLDENTRLSVVQNLKAVDDAYIAVDDDMTVNKTLTMIASKYSDSDIYFCKGGDRNKDNIPEFETCQKYNIKIIDGLGAKIDSSSRIVENVHTPAKILTARRYKTKNPFTKYLQKNIEERFVVYHEDWPKFEAVKKKWQKEGYIVREYKVVEL